jgi:hypothetical protein
VCGGLQALRLATHETCFETTLEGQIMLEEFVRIIAAFAFYFMPNGSDFLYDRVFSHFRFSWTAIDATQFGIPAPA